MTPVPNKSSCGCLRSRSDDAGVHDTIPRSDPDRSDSLRREDNKPDPSSAYPKESLTVHQQKIDPPKTSEIPPFPHLTGKGRTVPGKIKIPLLLTVSKWLQLLIFGSILLRYAYQFFVQKQRSASPILALLTLVYLLFVAVTLVRTYRDRPTGSD